MKVIFVTGPHKLKLKNPVLAIGVFDGVHLGHQYLIRKMVRRAKALNGTSVLMTFFPHPAQVLKPDVHPALLTPLPYRLRLIADLGVNVCLVVSFTRAFSRLTPVQFIDNYLARMISPKEVFVGDDFRFGEHRRGHFNFLEEQGQAYGFKVNVIPSVKLGKYDISSTLIRQLVIQGALAKVRTLLGRGFGIYGRVIRGDGRGRVLGFPTINLDTDEKILPPSGVYIVKVYWNEKVFFGMANVGRRPSFLKNAPISCEAHILDFKKNIYGKEVIVEFLKKIRNEKKFFRPEDLAEQLKKDESRASNFFESHTR